MPDFCFCSRHIEIACVTVSVRNAKQFYICSSDTGRIKLIVRLNCVEIRGEMKLNKTKKNETRCEARKFEYIFVSAENRWSGRKSVGMNYCRCWRCRRWINCNYNFITFAEWGMTMCPICKQKDSIDARRRLAAKRRECTRSRHTGNGLLQLKSRSMRDYSRMHNKNEFKREKGRDKFMKKKKKRNETHARELCRHRDGVLSHAHTHSVYPCRYAICNRHDLPWNERKFARRHTVDCWLVVWVLHST